MEAAGVVVDQVVRGVAFVGRVAVGCVRLQFRPVLSELRRGQGRAVVAAGCGFSRGACTAASNGPKSKHPRVFGRTGRHQTRLWNGPFG